MELDIGAFKQVTKGTLALAQDRFAPMHAQSDDWNNALNVGKSGTEMLK